MLGPSMTQRGVAMPDSFQLNGAGLDLELQDFLHHMSSVNAEMTSILTEHIRILRAGSSDDSRRAARSEFNTAVRNQILSSLAERSEIER